MSSSQVLSQRLQQAFRQLITDRIGITLRNNDQAGLDKFILERIKAVGLSLPEEYFLLMNENTAQSHEEWERLIAQITNTESFFFRDKGQFKLLKNYILPKLIDQKSQEKTLRICSAGCSTGEEPYSLAIVLKELVPDIDRWTLEIIGVDVNAEAIESAQQGIYRAWSFRGVDTALQNQFFRKADNTYHINDDIKAMVDFRVGNLLENSLLDPFLTIGNMDLILCRNVFIYFDNSAIEKAVSKIYDALSPLGYLLVGHTELYEQNSNKFHIKMFEESVAYQRPEHDGVQPVSEFLSLQTVSTSSNRKAAESDDHEQLSELLKGNDAKMRRTALNLLRLLPSDVRIAKLDNLTASELISQLENNLKETD